MVASRDDIDRAWGRLTAAIARRNAAGALAAVPAACDVGLLQAAGPAVLLALSQDAPGTEAGARALAAALLERDFDGDAALAGQLAAAVSGDSSGRDTLVIDLEEVATAMGDGGGWLDLRTGFAWPQELIDLGDTDEVPDPDEDPESGLWSPATDSRDAWQNIADYIDTLGDERAAADLRAAIEVQGGFRPLSRDPRPTLPLASRLAGCSQSSAEPDGREPGSPPTPAMTLSRSRNPETAVGRLRTEHRNRCQYVRGVEAEPL